MAGNILQDMTQDKMQDAEFIINNMFGVWKDDNPLSTKIISHLSEGEIDHFATNTKDAFQTYISKNLLTAMKNFARTEREKETQVLLRLIYKLQSNNVALPFGIEQKDLIKQLSQCVNNLSAEDSDLSSLRYNSGIWTLVHALMAEGEGLETEKVFNVTNKDNFLKDLDKVYQNFYFTSWDNLFRNNFDLIFNEGSLNEIMAKVDQKGEEWNIDMSNFFDTMYDQFSHIYDTTLNSEIRKVLTQGFLNKLNDDLGLTGENQLTQNTAFTILWEIIKKKKMASSSGSKKDFIERQRKGEYATIVGHYLSGSSGAAYEVIMATFANSFGNNPKSYTSGTSSKEMLTISFDDKQGGSYKSNSTAKLGSRKTDTFSIYLPEEHIDEAVLGNMEKLLKENGIDTEGAFNLQNILTSIFNIAYSQKGISFQKTGAKADIAGVANLNTRYYNFLSGYKYINGNVDKDFYNFMFALSNLGKDFLFDVGSSSPGQSIENAIAMMFFGFMFDTELGYVQDQFKDMTLPTNTINLFQMGSMVVSASDILAYCCQFIENSSWALKNYRDRVLKISVKVPSNSIRNKAHTLGNEIDEPTAWNYVRAQNFNQTNIGITASAAPLAQLINIGLSQIK